METIEFNLNKPPLNNVDVQVVCDYTGLCLLFTVEGNNYRLTLSAMVDALANSMGDDLDNKDLCLNSLQDHLFFAQAQCQRLLQEVRRKQSERDYPVKEKVEPNDWSIAQVSAPGTVRVNVPRETGTLSSLGDMTRGYLDSWRNPPDAAPIPEVNTPTWGSMRTSGALTVAGRHRILGARPQVNTTEPTEETPF